MLLGASIEPERRESYPTVMTGVWIQETFQSVPQGNLSIYFGCQTGIISAMSGGSGWLWWSHELSNTTVLPLMSDGEPVWANGIQFSSTLSRDCPTVPPGEGDGSSARKITYSLETLLIIILGLVYFVYQI